jgi:geranylgeranyl reductase family protein
MISSGETDCDVLVVGGGPAGSSCAERLVNGGLSVVVLDKATFPRDKICAGWITPPIVRLLDLDLDDFRGSNVLQPITAFRTGVIGRKSTVETIYETEVSYGIRRCEFDHYLLQRSGAAFRLGERVQSLEATPDGWLVNGEIRARMLVGAGGHFCPIARRLNPDNETHCDVVQAQEVEFLMSGEQQRECAVSPTTPELYFAGDLKGYGWCFRKGDYLNVGIGREGERHLGEHRDDFLKFLRDTERLNFDLPGHFKGHAYRLYGRTIRQIVSDNVLLIGDALGLAFPKSGEGIRPAIESGLLAADVILKSDGDFQRENLQPYAEAIQSRFGKAGETSLLDRLPSAAVNACARELLRSKAFTRHMLLDRWFLHRDQSELQVERLQEPAPST